MAKKKKIDSALGHDPFADMDMEWLDWEESPEGDQSAPGVLSVGRELPMPQATFHFPADFKWGVATAAHQVEGDNTNNDWWAWEQQEGHIKDGRKSGRACNWWKKAEDDFDRPTPTG
jgi:hypothetical protein